MRKTMYLVDGNALAYRAFYGVGPLTTKSGLPTGAIYGFWTMLQKLRQENKPDYLAVCFDAPGPTARHEQFAAYKQHRKPMPAELREQLATLKLLLAAAGVAQFELSGYEADDILATFAQRFKTSVDVYIVSGDKDMLQLVDEYVKVYNPQRKPPLMDAAAVVRHCGVEPCYITDWLALAGDGSDNIPGVPGIGAKTAAELITSYGSLDYILTKRETLAPRRRALLGEYESQARLSKSLVTLQHTVPLTALLDDMRCIPADPAQMRPWFERLEFRGFSAAAGGTLPESTVNRIALGLRPRDTAAVADVVQQLSAFRGDGGQPCLVIALDGESLSIGDDAVEAVITVSPALTWSDIDQCLAPVLASPRVLKIGYDCKALWLACRQRGLQLQGPFFDIMVAAYLTAPDHGIQPLATLIGSAGPTAAVAEPEAECHRLWQAYTRLRPRLRELGLEQLFTTIEMPLIPVLSCMQQAGIAVDVPLLRALGAEFDSMTASLRAAIYEKAGESFNINSPKQLAQVLFTRLGLPVLKRVKSGPSTDQEVLSRLAAGHELPRMILEFRELVKLRTTYIDGLLALVDERTERVYPTFNQAVAATGRLSCSEPNLQNIPVRTAAGKKIRAAFTAGRPDWRLLSADYSQIELRVLAHLSGDAALIEAFAQGQDIHAVTAAQIFHLTDCAAVTPAMRDVAKRVNFGIIYGMGAYGLARDLSVTVAEAEQFIERYFAQYPGVRRYFDEEIARARQDGVVRTVFGRVRFVPAADARAAPGRGFHDRVIMNTPIQGTAADLIKIAMIRLAEQLPRQKLQARLLLQVHDELLLETPLAELSATAALVTDCMEQAAQLRVPLPVTIKSGWNWRDMS